MDVLIPSYTSYLAVISLPYHKRGTWRYTACDFSGGGNHSPTILTSYKNGGVFSLFLASSFYLLAVLEVSGILVLFSRPVVVLRYCFRFNWVSLFAAPFQNKRETKKPKKRLELFGYFYSAFFAYTPVERPWRIRSWAFVHLNWWTRWCLVWCFMDGRRLHRYLAGLLKMNIYRRIGQNWL